MLQFKKRKGTLTLLINYTSVKLKKKQKRNFLCKKRHGKKEPPLWTVGEGLYWAVALGQNSRGRVSKETKGVCEVGGVRRGFIARAGFPYKEESAGFSGV